MGESFDYVFKLLLLGDSGVGKSSLLVRFRENIFTSTVISTIGVDFKIRTIELDGKKIKLQIWDTAGQECFRAMMNLYYGGANGFMIVYDVTDDCSFSNISIWIRHIEEHGSPDVPKIILGNMNDIKEERRVSREQGEELARRHDCRFMETSAKNSENVDVAFRILSRDILAQEERKPRADYTPLLLNRHGEIRVSDPKKEKRSKRSKFGRCCTI